MAKWKEAVGDAFSDLVNMKLLRVSVMVIRLLS